MLLSYFTLYYNLLLEDEIIANNLTKFDDFESN